MALDLRTLADDDVAAWARALATGFLRSPEVSPEEVEFQRAGMELDRTHGVFDGDRCVATLRTMPQRLTVPGGATLPACAVTTVAVLPTHRRRGLLTRMMARAMEAARERGDACATLVASEYPIYGRFGFGPATWTTEYEVDLVRAGLGGRHRAPAGSDGGTVELVDVPEVLRVAPALHDEFRVQPHRQGAIDRPERWWRRHTGVLRSPIDPPTRHFHALYRDADGEPRGIVTYTADDVWRGKVPYDTLTVVDLFATTPSAERALWRYVMSIDWVSTLRSGYRAPDDVLPLLLPDPRTARAATLADFLWLRPLDVPRMLRTRGYPVAGTLVLELRDAAGAGGPGAGGRFRLDAGPDGATCEPTDDAADLAMEIGELGTLYLGDEAATRLVALGRVTEHRPGAAALADALLRTGRRAWCPDMF